MWLFLITLSCITAGFYDASKKQSLKDNAVFPVLLLNTLFSSLLFHEKNLKSKALDLLLVLLALVFLYVGSK